MTNWLRSTKVANVAALAVLILKPGITICSTSFDLRRNTGDDRRRAHDMNTANWIPDLFMKRMEARGDWTFFRTNDVPELHDLYGKAFEEKYVAYEAAAERGEIWSETRACHRSMETHVTHAL